MKLKKVFFACINIAVLTLGIFTFSKAKEIETSAVTEIYSVYTTGFNTNTKNPRRIIESTDSTIKLASKGGFGYIDQNGDLYSWGGNQSGQLGHGTTTFARNPIKVSLPGKVREAAIGEKYSSAILEDGSLYMWGKNDRGQLGTGDEIDQMLPVKVPLSEPIISISFKNTFFNSSTAAVGISGKVYAWGDDIFKGDNSKSNIPIELNLGTQVGQITSVAVGPQYGLVLNTNGEVYGFGYSFFGVLGQGNEDHIFNRVVKINFNGEKIRKINAEYYHSAALSENNNLFMWGLNEFGKIGNGTYIDQYLPVNIGIFEDFALGGDFSIGIKTTGEIYHWGDNRYNQLGISGVSSLNLPTLNGKLKGKLIAAGTYDQVVYAPIPKISAKKEIGIENKLEARINEEIDYKISLTNYGGTNSYDNLVKDNYIMQYDYIKATESSMYACTKTSLISEIVCSVPLIKPGETIEITLTFKVNSNAKIGDKLNNSITVNNADNAIIDPPTKPQELTVGKGEGPIISNLTFTEYSKTISNQFVDVRDNIVINDLEDGVISSDKLTATVNGKETSLINLNSSGLYKVVYTVNDSNNNTSTGVKIFLVNDGSYVVGENLILQAYDFAKTISEVDTSEQKILSDSQAKVFDKLTTENITAQTQLNVQKNQYAASVGVYEVNISIANLPNLVKKIKVTVRSGNVPIIKAVKFTNLMISQSPSSYNLRNNVTALDLEDGNLTEQIKIFVNNNLQEDIILNTAGKYDVTYQVIDKDENLSTFTRTIIVNDGSYVIGETTFIYAQNFSLKPSEVKTDDLSIINNAKVKVWEKETGQEINPEIILEINKGQYQAKSGNYQITFIVKNDKFTNMVINANIIQGSIPTLKMEKFIELEKTNQESFYNLLTNIQAFDEEDGNISNKINALTNFGLVNLLNDGVYKYEFSVKDKDNNEVNGAIIVLVNNGDYYAGNEVIVKANNFKLAGSQVQLENSKIAYDAKFRMYSKQNGQEIIDLNNVIIDYNDFSETIGKYEILFRSKQDLTASKTIIATVTAGEVPFIDTKRFEELQYSPTGQEIDTHRQVKVFDIEDYRNSEGVTYTGTVNTANPGVHLVIYSYLDNDKNRIDYPKVFLVNDGTYFVGNEYILKADKQIIQNSSEVNTDDLAILNAANVKVYSKSTGADLTNIVPIQVEKTNYSANTGTYELIFKIENEANLHAITTAKVIADSVPRIEFNESEVQLSLNQQFDLMQGVTAYDNEDGNLTSAISIRPYTTISTSKAGLNKVIYEVTDQNGNTVQKIRNVIVNDGQYIIGEKYIFKANNFSVRISQVDDSTSGILFAAKSNIQLFDRQTLSPINHLNKINVDKGSYEAKIGEYNDIKLEVSDEPMINKAITINVHSGKKAVLEVEPQFVEILQNDESFSIGDGLNVDEEEDGIVYVNISMNKGVDRGEIDKSIAGVQTISYYIKDSDGNEQRILRTVLVNDGNYISGERYIIQAENFEKYVHEMDTTDETLKQYAKVKVYDKLTGEEVTKKVNITYSNYQKMLGTYEITFTVEDDLLATKTIQVNVISGQAPKILGPKFSETIVENNIIDANIAVSAIDAEEGYINDTMKTKINGLEERYIDQNNHGINRINYEVTDQDQNTNTFERVILVNDGNYIVNYDSEQIYRAKSVVTNINELANVNYEQLAEVKGWEINTNNTIDLKLTSNRPDNQGLYDASYESSDESIKISKKITVTGPNVKTNGDEAIQAYSFVESFDKVDTINYIEKSNAKAWDINTGESILLELISEKPTKSGLHQLTFRTPNGTAINAYVTLTDENTVYNENNNEAISASNFQVELSEINTTDFRTLANAQAWNVNDGTQVDVMEPTNKPTSVGTHLISFKTAKGTEIIVSLIVTDLNANPIITAPEFTVINLFDSIDLLANVSASDKEDGDLTSKINASIDGYSLTNYQAVIHGIIKVIYEVEDENGNRTIFERILLVNDGFYTVGDKYIMRAVNFIVKESEVSLDESKIKQNAKVSLYDKKTGEEIFDLANIMINYQTPVYEAKVGVYPINFKHQNDSMLTTNITARVVDFNPIYQRGIPTFNLPNKTTIYQNDSFDLLTNVYAFDLEDGDLTSKIKVIKSNVDVTKVGEYEIIYEVFDANQNRAEASQVVIVIAKNNENNENNENNQSNEPSTQDIINEKYEQTGQNTNIKFLVSLLIFIILSIRQLKKIKN